MLASGATYGNGHKVLVFLGISFDGRFNGAFIGIKEFLGAFAGQHIVGDGFVGSGKLAQAGHPEWIGQEPDIGHEIGIYRHAVFESEAEDVHGHGGGPGSQHCLVELGGQLMDAQGTGVDDLIGPLFEVFQ